MTRRYDFDPMQQKITVRRIPSYEEARGILRVHQLQGNLDGDAFRIRGKWLWVVDATLNYCPDLQLEVAVAVAVAVSGFPPQVKAEVNPRLLAAVIDYLSQLE